MLGREVRSECGQNNRSSLEKILWLPPISLKAGTRMATVQHERW